MKKLIMKTFLFAAPVGLIFIFPLYVLSASGEFMTAGRIIAMQSADKEPNLILQAYSDPWSYIKMAGIKQRRPELIALGTSRTMQFRQAFFKVPFYNAAKAIDSTAHLVTVLESLNEKEIPRIIILGLDPNFFNPNWVWYSSNTPHAEPKSGREWLKILSQKWLQVYSDFINRKFRLKHLNPKRNDQGFHRTGLGARVHNRGFLNDGSFLYLRHIVKREAGPVPEAQRERNRALEDIREKDDLYVPASRLSETSLRELEAFLILAKRRGVHVAGYLTPMAPSMLEALEAEGPNYEYLRKITPALQKLFQKYGYVYEDFLDSRKLGATDAHFVDDVHETGEITLRILKRLAAADAHIGTSVAAPFPEESEMNRKYLEAAKQRVFTL